MLEVKNLRFRWQADGPWMLNGVNLRVAPGETVGIMGRSGCGKSTMARLLTGHMPMQGGEVLLDGKPLPSTGARPVQLVMQHAELALNPRWRIGESLREGWQPDAQTLHSFGIREAWLKRFPHELSGGEMQRISIVRALIPQLRVLVADELTTMHDPITQVQIWRALQEQARTRGVGLLAISHDAALLQALNARVLHMRDGVLHAG
ncbi:MAG: ATP-binding cassette domain-containing protein [Brachymonas sp.]|nr:ATP-binding cassette domain-containing protein [Brachymonas sp.]